MTSTKPFSVWRGRIDPEDGTKGMRWHQRVSDGASLLQSTSSLPEGSAHSAGAPVLVGFASDEGVKRNQGRIGAAEGPAALRNALANLACADSFELFDVGDIECVNGDLEGSQQMLAEVLAALLQKKVQPCVLGGGHEVGWASFSGIQQYLKNNNLPGEVGIINFDAHFDLRSVADGPSSGTPFRQCQQYCGEHGLPFHYFVIGLNPSANTEALFEFADRHGVKWVVDTAVHQSKLATIEDHLDTYLKRLDYLYLTICLDVFNCAYAPGVSAPAALGIDPASAIYLLKAIKRLCGYHNVELLLFDVAEMNPRFDRDSQTARLAARLIYEMVN